MAGRPRKVGAPWFSHDSDARNNRKLKALENKFGIEGYAIFFKTLELMAQQEGSRIEFSEEEVQLVAGDFGVDPETLSGVWTYCIILKLFNRNDRFIFSLSLKERLKPMFAKRQRDRIRQKGIIADDNAKNEAKSQEVKGIIADDNATKESKEKETKEEVINVSGKDQLDQLQEDLISRITKNHSERNQRWKQQAQAVGVDVEALKLAFITKAIRDNYSLEERNLLAGFDGYLRTTVNNSNKKQNEQRSKPTGKVHSRHSRSKGTSARQPETNYTSDW